MSILNVIKQCKSIKQLHQIHAHTIIIGLLPYHKLAILNNIISTFTSLISKNNNKTCSNLSLTSYALSLFNSIPNPTTFTYNTLIRINTLLSSPYSAVQIFSSLRRLSLPLDFHTYPLILKACSQIHSLSLAQCLHSQVIKFGFLADLFVLNSVIRVYSVNDRVNDAHKVFCECSYRDVVSYNAMIDGFVKSFHLDRARELFDEMPQRNEVSWGTMIAGYSHGKLCREAIQLFNEMISLNFVPDNIALVSVLSACAQLGELEQGRFVHDYITRNGIRVDSYLTTGLVDLYAKCGCVEIAREIFESCKDKDVFTWNAMLVGFAIHGEGLILLDYFSRMVAEGVQPDGISFLGVLIGCSHAGLVNEARKVFNEMETVLESFQIEDWNVLPLQSEKYGSEESWKDILSFLIETMETAVKSWHETSSVDARVYFLPDKEKTQTDKYPPIVNIDKAFETPETHSSCFSFLRQYAEESFSKAACLVAAKKIIAYPQVWKGQGSRKWKHAQSDGFFVQFESPSVRKLWFIPSSNEKGQTLCRDPEVLDIGSHEVVPRLFKEKTSSS